MSLTNIAIPLTGTATTPAIDRAIRVTSSAINQLMYTVPAGRKFSGYATNGTSQLNVVVYINGTSQTNGIQGNPNTYPVPVYLNAGDTVYSVASSTYLFGVESDV